MKISVLKCPECKQEIYSRAQHDCRNCKCGNIMVDGGRYSYTEKDTWIFERYGGKDIDNLKSRVVDIDITERKMYYDWNESVDKLGVYNDTL